MPAAFTFELPDNTAVSPDVRRDLLNQPSRRLWRSEPFPPAQRDAEATVALNDDGARAAGVSSCAAALRPGVVGGGKCAVTLAGPNRISLAWNGRPEAARHEIIRNGGNLPAAVIQPQGVSYIDENLPAGDYTYTVYSIVRLASGEELAGEMSSDHPVAPVQHAGHRRFGHVAGPAAIRQVRLQST